MRAYQNQIPPPPLDAEIARRLATQRDWDLDVGAGQGLFAIRHARANPARAVLAIERTYLKHEQLARRRTAHPELSNLFCVRADALAVLAHFVPADSINNIYLLYPNPYPKPAQAKRRWVNQAAFTLLRNALKPGGTLTLATNLNWYAIEAERELTDRWNFHLVSRRELAATEPARTHFEKKYLERGETCFELTLTKPGPRPEC